MLIFTELIIFKSRYSYFSKFYSHRTVWSMQWFIDDLAKFWHKFESSVPSGCENNVVFFLKNSFFVFRFVMWKCEVTFAFFYQIFSWDDIFKNLLFLSIWHWVVEDTSFESFHILAILSPINAFIWRQLWGVVDQSWWKPCIIRIMPCFYRDHINIFFSKDYILLAATADHKFLCNYLVLGSKTIDGQFFSTILWFFDMGYFGVVLEINSRRKALFRENFQSFICKDIPTLLIP